MIRSRLARRMLLVFVVCALLPVTALTLISWRTTYAELQDHSRDRLHEATKTLGMSLFERFRFCESELRFAAREYLGGKPLETLHENLERFEGLMVIDASGVAGRVGREFPGVVPERAAAEHLANNGAAISFLRAVGIERPKALITVPLDGDDPSRGHLIGWVSPDYAWGEMLLAGLPGSTFLELRAPGVGLLLSTLDSPTQTYLAVGGGSGTFDWNDGVEDYLGVFSELPLQLAFAVEGVTLYAFERRSEALAAVPGYGRAFVLTGLATLWIILLLSIGQIRRTLVPLDALTAATKAVAHRDFSHRVEVASNDEFRDLAESFNTMSGRLGSQFEHLAALAEIDRAILSSTHMDGIVDKTIELVAEGYGVQAVAIGLLDPSGQRLKIYATGTETSSSVRALSPGDAAALANSESFVFEPGEARPHYVGPIATGRNGRVAAIPVLSKDSLAGVMMLRVDDARQLADDDLVQLRQIADQVAVGLSNAKLFEQLEDMKTGALMALARTVDAKSEWTNGHSERVTAMAVKLAKELGMDETELEVIHRGGLLHDIGKIGVPSFVLDKPGKLTDEEYDLMKEHPVIGARILEPIPAYADVLAIVRQHHERLDGKGYPDGLRGNQIAFEARITAVADVFDACRSDRPYRAGMPLEKVVQIIRSGSGSQFDPVVVDAFDRVMARESGTRVWPRAS